MGLIYHTSQLLHQYWQGKTIVNIDVNRVFLDTLPGITICFPYMLDIRKLSKIDDHLKNINDQYQDSLKKLELNQEMSKEHQKELREIYYQAQIEVIRRISNNSLKMKDIFQNYSIDFLDENREELITIQLYGDMNSTFSKNKTADFIGNPIVSYEICQDRTKNIWLISKCFTYFSSLEKRWRNFKSYYRVISIIMRYDFKSIPPFFLNMVVVAIHSPNTIPQLQDESFMFFPLKHEYQVTYHKIYTKLLDSNYDSNCFEYDLDYKFVQNFNISLELKVRLACYNECRKDCNFTYYSLVPSTKAKLNNSNEMRIYLWHNNQADIAITHLPEITFISLVSNFGGLIGMWLGISVMVMFDELFKLIGLMIRSKPTKNIFFVHIKQKFTHSSKSANVFHHGKPQTINQGY